jgi:hypothetical protein
MYNRVKGGKVMNRSKTMIVAFMLGVFFTAPSNVFAEDKAGERGVIPITQEIHLSAGQYIIDSAVADITGDGVVDNIYLIGYKEKKSDIFSNNMSLMVRDGATNNVKTMGLNGFSGYEGKIFAGDFTGDKVSDVMISAPTGGSGGIVSHLIVNYNLPEPTIIFDDKNNEGAKFTGNFVDDYKAQLINENTGRTIFLDLENKKDFYIQSAVYDENGKLLKEVKPISYPFTILEPIVVNYDNVYELKGIQRIIGAYGADGIGNIYSRWRYEDGQWKIKRIEVSSVLFQ